ncbi:hypothetical protein KDA_40910 [Dictyobacter alpinus]|uniref:Uncharacterized protein n=1 Tax=Dictyobacter alpinus TaxID=2014873 RepID=A0A402BBF6_9CHLR|nr:hypothetical protein KDA_40910 [Dictyobacter alpinus]
MGIIPSLDGSRLRPSGITLLSLPNVIDRRNIPEEKDTNYVEDFFKKVSRDDFLYTGLRAGMVY